MQCFSGAKWSVFGELLCRGFLLPLEFNFKKEIKIFVSVHAKLLQSNLHSKISTNNIV